MPKHVRIILDSGCFLPLKDHKQTFSEVGYYACENAACDFIVTVDGYPHQGFDDFAKLRPGGAGQKDSNSPAEACYVDIEHVAPRNSKVHGVKFAPTFHSELLHLGELYGCRGIRVSPKNFDCVLRFQCGLFSSYNLKKRTFRKHRKEKGGHVPVEGVGALHVERPITQDIEVTFLLDDDEDIVFKRDGVDFWRASDSGFQQSLVIEVPCDEHSAAKFFCESFAEGLETYWLPNPGDPPPICSLPPCQDGA